MTIGNHTCVYNVSFKTIHYKWCIRINSGAQWHTRAVIGAVHVIRSMSLWFVLGNKVQPSLDKVTKICVGII